MFANASTSAPQPKKLYQALEGLPVGDMSLQGYCTRTLVNFMTLPLLAEGGEGWVVDASSIRAGEVAKIFKPPALVAVPEDAKQKWDEYPGKLPKLMKLELPREAIKPSALITKTASGRSGILGYFMPRISGIELTELTRTEERKSNGYSLNDTTEVFRRILALTEQLHALGIVIGDYKPQNYLLTRLTPHLVDLESVGFDTYECHGFTEQYVDPLICDPSLDYPFKVLPGSKSSDHYACEVMLFECLTGISPYGGVHIPEPGQEQVPDYGRSMRALSVYNSRVKLPEFIDRLDLLPEKLTKHFIETFEHRQRTPVTRSLLDFSWSSCRPCNVEYAREICPACEPIVDTLFYKRTGSPGKAVGLETASGKGAIVTVTTRDANPAIIRALPASSHISLTINGRTVLENLTSKATLISAAHHDIIFTGTGSDEVVAHSISAHTRRVRTGVLRRSDQQFFHATARCFAYLNTDGDLSIGMYPDGRSSRDPLALKESRYTLGLTDTRFMALGDQLIACSDGHGLSLIRGSREGNRILQSEKTLDSEWKQRSLEVHPSRPYALATFQHHRTGEESAIVYAANGKVVVELSSSRKTRWWFGNRLVDDTPTLLYWQDQKLCEALILEKGVSPLWGIQGLPEPQAGHRPIIAGSSVYLVLEGQAHRILLD